ncbi:MAG: hypothetical protein U5K37_04680 [Natrialbaceae archaeon]|nr:hypothetical protein [Natrialbaceae archaeon]
MKRVGGIVLVGVLLFIAGGVVAGTPGNSGILLQSDEDPAPDFAVVSVNTDLQPSSGTNATITIKNTGDAPANDTTVMVSASGGVIIDNGGSQDVLGRINASETRTVRVTASAGQEVSAGDKPLSVTINYEDPDGNTQVWGSSDLTIPVYERQRFSILNLEDTLAVGYDGVIRGTVRNDGPKTLSDAVLAIEPATETMFVRDRIFALPRLEPGESTNFTYPTDVMGEADPGPRNVRFAIEYASNAGAPLNAVPIRKGVTIDPRTPEFKLEPADPPNATVPAGGATQYRLRVTNQWPETLSNIDAKLYTEHPISAGDTEAFIPSLAPNESTVVVFTLSAAAVRQTTYPVEMDFLYDTNRSPELLSETYTLAIEVGPPVQSDQRDTIATVLAGLAVVIVGASAVGVLWWRHGVRESSGDRRDQE